MSQIQDQGTPAVTTGAGSLLRLDAFQEELTVAATAMEKTPEQAQKYARKCLKEMEATPRESWLKPAAKFGNFILGRSYEPELDINLEALEELKELSKDNLLLFLWSHKSHMDSFAFLIGLYENNFKPLPLVFAGANMNFAGFGTLARRVGSIFLRRSFQDDPIYKLVFRHYIDYLIRNHIPLTWSIEGTRSRTGRLSPPKLGILNWVLEACHREDMKDVKLVPISIAFDRIAEIDDYVAIQKGLPKRKESLKWFMDYVFGMNKPNGKIYIRFAPPVSMEDAAEIIPGETGRAGESVSEAQRLAFEVCTRIEKVTPIKSADVLTMVLLGANGRALTSMEIHQQASEISSLIRERDLPTASGFSLDNPQQVSAAVFAMGRSGLIKCYDKGTAPVYYIPGEKRLAAAYYRNTITHYFLAAAIGEVALAACSLGIEIPTEALLRKKVNIVRALYRFEFFYPPSEEFWPLVLQAMNQRYPDWNSGTVSVHKAMADRPPRFGHAILRSLTEAYLIIATSLLDFKDKPVTDRKKFTEELLLQGKQMLLQRCISCESAISKDVLANGLKLAAHTELLEGDGAGLLQRREEAVQRVVDILAAINLLQECYDDAWFSHSTGP